MVMNRKKIAIGMSGGVDSSVSALLVQQSGADPIGLFMKNWDEQDETGACVAEQDFEDVARVCARLEIPYYAVNFVQEYRESVFEQFLHDLRLGITPNPDVLCNREIKFDRLLEKALSLGADHLATGHYCRKRDTSEGPLLLKGKDPNKDQSYFLHAVKRHALDKVIFPVGELLKPEVRKLARAAALPTAEKKDSVGICFIGKRDFRPFLQRYLGADPGTFQTLEGQVVGEHQGVALYTLGQRRGLGIGGAGEPWFVVGKDPINKVVFVAQGDDHPALYSQALVAKQVNWIVHPISTPFRCCAKVRYRQEDQRCEVAALAHDEVLVTFESPQRAVTPGQSVVFYEGAVCLGGGVIVRSLPIEQ